MPFWSGLDLPGYNSAQCGFCGDGSVPPDAVPVRVAVIIPAYEQPGLLIEALDTALSQITDFAFAIVLVNDGCPFAETDEVCREFAAANSGKIYYLHQRNRGLSAARNRGIEFALAVFPALDSVYFLDADNRIEPGLLQRLHDALHSAGQEAGWAYTDVDKFGFAEFCDTSGPYSPLEHLFRNFCEAGSMVSRRMLDAGLRFDEGMRSGSEDWEFWLQGLENGFRGVHVPGAGFHYRKRGESMLVQSERHYWPISEHIRARHPRLFDLRSVMRIEAATTRRYAIYLPDHAAVRCLTHADDQGAQISREELVRLLLRNLVRPDYAACPGHILVMNAALFDTLRAHRLLQAVLWVLEQVLLQCSYAGCRVAIEHTDGDRTLSWKARTYPADITSLEPTSKGEDHIAAVHAQTLADTVRIRAFGSGRFAFEEWKLYQEARVELRLRLPGSHAATQPGADRELFAFCTKLTEQWAREDHSGWGASHIERYRCGFAMPWDLYRNIYHVPTVLPLRVGAQDRQAALVLDPSRASAALSALARFMELLRGSGYRLHLAGFGREGLCWPAEAHELFDSVLPLPLSLIAATPQTTGFDAYLGTPVVRPSEGDLAAVVGALAGFDLVVSVENSIVHAAAGRLRDLGVEMWALLGTGTAPAPAAELVNACAAFEHAYRTIVVLDDGMLGLCRALGLPPEKLVCWKESRSTPRGPVATALHPANRGSRTLG
jgi:glycosyltransferase involved in cell wall biosynthesis